MIRFLIMFLGVGLRMLDLSSLVFGASQSVPHYSAATAPSYDNKPGRNKTPEPLLASADGYIYKIQFKRMHRYFILAANAPRGIQAGTA